jgi:hypothetical protein
MVSLDPITREIFKDRKSWKTNRNSTNEWIVTFLNLNKSKFIKQTRNFHLISAPLLNFIYFLLERLILQHMKLTLESEYGFFVEFQVVWDLEHFIGQ